MSLTLSPTKFVIRNIICICSPILKNLSPITFSNSLLIATKFSVSNSKAPKDNMAAFSSSFLFDSSSAAANSINNMCALFEQPDNANNSTTCFSQFYQPADQTLLIHQNLDHSTKPPAFGINDDHEASLFSVTNKNSMDSSSIVTDHDKYEHHHCIVPITQKVLNPMNNKRKSKDGSLANSAQSKDMRKVKGNKKQKKVKDVEKMKKKSKDEKKATEEAPEGYIHVRARRGQATDSHSLAERVRRERISERMKLLQALVPGCDKVTGKALMLDEIINYVQSLQNQVEFLSMKLASVNPMFYDFGMDMETFMVRPDNDQNLSNLSSPLPTMQPFSSPTASDYPLVDNSANSLLLFQQAQLPNTLPQGNRQVLWEVVDEQRQRIVNQPGLMNNNNLFSFH